MALVIADRIKETTTTVGTGALSLLGAMTGFRAFSAKCSVGDTCYYAIQAVDSIGSPTGEWECGLGTYSAANTLTRTTVTASSNADAAVSLASGTKQVFISVPAVQAAWPRERLTADRTYYVRTDGADTNTGLANTAGGAFRTIQKAVDVISASLDAGINQVTIQVGDGTYTEPTTLKTVVGSLAPIIKGNASTPDNVVISTTSANCFVFSNAGRWIVKSLKTQTTSSGRCFTGSGTMSYLTLEAVTFGACASDHILATTGATVNISATCKITGSAASHITVVSGGILSAVSVAYTLTGTPAFSTTFLQSDIGGIAVVNACTFSGAATGVRYIIGLNSVVQTYGGGESYLPGSSAGTKATGGQYA